MASSSADEGALLEVFSRRRSSGYDLAAAFSVRDGFENARQLAGLVERFPERENDAVLQFGEEAG